MYHQPGVVGFPMYTPPPGPVGVGSSIVYEQVELDYHTFIGPQLQPQPLGSYVDDDTLAQMAGSNQIFTVRPYTCERSTGTEM
jgi:hypothetical protein